MQKCVNQAVQAFKQHNTLNFNKLKQCIGCWFESLESKSASKSVQNRHKIYHHNMAKKIAPKGDFFVLYYYSVAIFRALPDLQRSDLQPVGRSNITS